QHDSMRVLTQAQRLALAREAVERLAVQVEGGGNAARNLADVRSARRSSAGLEPEVRGSLQAVGRVAERRLLTQRIAEVRSPAERGRWGEVASKARAGLRDLQGAVEPALESAEFRAGRAEVRDALQELVRVAERIDALDRL